MAGWGGWGGQTFHVVFSLIQNGFQKRARVVQIASKLLMPCYRFCVRVHVCVCVCDPDITSPHIQPHMYAYTESDSAIVVFEMTLISRHTERVQKKK